MRRRLSTALTIAFAGALLAPTPASANNFGPIGCCFYADNSIHTYYPWALTAGTDAALDFAMATRLASTDMSVDKFESSNADTDIIAVDTTYTNETWWGLWTCDAIVIGSSTQCNQGTMRFNLKFGTPTTSVTCHEVGHSVGLDHATPTSSCMHTPAGTWNDYDTHDRSHINGYY